MNLTDDPIRTSSAASFQFAEEQVCSNLDLYSDWLCGEVRASRKPSVFFGPISTQELVAVQMNPAASAEQKSEACLEIRARYLKEKAEYVQQIAGVM